MGDIQISCNLLSCRKKLNQLACVTTCLHIFCINHLQNSDENRRSCLVCGNSLHDEFDVIQVNLSPKERYKAMVLIGLNPEQIMEIANRAINFFCYQLNYDNKQTENIIQNVKEQHDQLKQYCEKLTNKYKIEVHKLQRNIEKVKLNLQDKMKEVELQQQHLKEYKKSNNKLHAEIEACKQEIITMRSVPNIDGTFVTSDTYFNRKLHYPKKFPIPLNNNNHFPMYNNYMNPSIYGESTNCGRFSQ